jgi:ABC-type uncharacterized transport system permease subunit
MSAARIAAPRIGTPQVLLGLSIAILVIVVAVPVLLIFVNAFWVDGHFNVADVIKVLRQKETYQALLNSLILATGVTVTGTIVGTFFAWLVTRTDLPFKGTMKVLFLVPFMLPSFIGATLLLFTNAFSAYATAAALVSQGSPLVPLQIGGTLSSEVILGQENVGKAMALAMVIVVALVMGLYAWLDKRSSRWLSR